MANHTAYRFPDDIQGIRDEDLIPFWQDVGYGRNYGKFYGGYLVAPNVGAGSLATEPQRGVHTNNLPVGYTPVNHTAYKVPSLTDVFYNRLSVEPANIDFGILVSTQEVQVTVWNGFLESSVNLESILTTGFDGISLIGDLPPPDVVFSPLQERIYTVRATSDGPPNIDATLTYDWETPYVDNVVTIVGRRIVMFPYLFRPGTTETLNWLTQVQTNDDGGENRSSIREAGRQVFNVRAFIPPNEHSRADNMMYGWRHQIWGVPHWGEQRKPTSAVTANDTVINVDTQYGDFRAGSLAVIWENERKFDLFTILSFTTSQITLDRGITYDFGTDALVAPVRTARIVSTPQRTSNGYTDTFSVNFDVDDNIALPTSAPAGPLGTYDGEDTYLGEALKPNDQNFNEQYTRDIRVVDFGTGVVRQFSTWNYTKLGREFAVVLEGLQDIWEFREWLHRRAGRQRPFWMPTYENNMRVVGTGNIGLNFTIMDDANREQGSDRDHIYVRMKDGTEYLRRVTDIAAGVDGILNVAIDIAIIEDKADVDYISYFGLKRLSSDRIQLRWFANNVVRCVIPILEIEP